MAEAFFFVLFIFSFPHALGGVWISFPFHGNTLLVVECEMWTSSSCLVCMRVFKYAVQFINFTLKLWKVGLFLWSLCSSFRLWFCLSGG